MRGMNLKRLLILVIILAGLSLGLVLDLANRGLFWQFAWSVSGEEDPIAQIRGVVQWAGNVFRPQPNTNPMTPINHTHEYPFGVNTFLEQETEAEKVAAKVQMIADMGFGWIRQQFIWEDIEVHGKGDFTDRRNDMDGDGVIDPIDAWPKYDRIVDLADEHGLRIQARLDNPPDWSRAAPRAESGAFAPPDDYQDFVDFAVAVAERYKGRIHYYQVWNEPNIYPEWGNYPVSPEDYTRLLCMTYDALKAVDPEIVVISGALAPTQALTGRDLNDFIFLQRMYQAGAGDCFDILSVQGYGLNSGPTDQRMRPTIVNVARNLYIRDLMVANGDAHKAIWISEAAWNYVPTREANPGITEPRTLYGQVTPQQAADYMPQYYQRALEDWPWVGVVNYWFFSRAHDHEANQPFYYFRMVEPYFNPENALPFEPMPVYYTVRDYLLNLQPTLYPGVHQAEGHWALTNDGDSAADPDAQFGRVQQADTIRFEAEGTDAVLRIAGAGTVTITDANDDTIADVAFNHTVLRDLTLDLGRTADRYTIVISGDNVALDAVTLIDRTFQNVYPWVVVAVIGALMLLIAVIGGLQERRQ
jgi:polysaccharide biosynthesis protein PslG